MSDIKPSTVIELRKVSMGFAKPSGALQPIVADIDLSIGEGEILGLLGRSGSGKSTLLRIAGGLIKPTAGEVIYGGAALTGPADGIAVVFQSFALYPWLTVLQNVVLGLDSLGIELDEAQRRAEAAIDLIGLDGFQSAYPRELSGGMRQRVGFARAIVSRPKLLLMDEPFSALDVLTAETLRTDFLDLWAAGSLPTKGVLMVTHNIEEAVLMCDRILVLAPNPGHLAAEIRVSLPQPRNRLDDAFHQVVDEIYAILTSRITAAIGAQSQLHGGLVQHLPPASPSQLSSFAEALAAAPYCGHAELAEIARPLALSTNDIFAIATALHLLEFGEFAGGSIKLTASGRVFAECAGEGRKRLFKEHLLRFVPLAAHIRKVLDEREGHAAPRARFDFELQDHLNRGDAETTLRTAIAWGRYAELFTYDDRRRRFGLLPVDP